MGTAQISHKIIWRRIGTDRFCPPVIQPRNGSMINVWFWLHVGWRFQNCFSLTSVLSYFGMIFASQASCAIRIVWVSEIHAVMKWHISCFTTTTQCPFQIYPKYSSSWRNFAEAVVVSSSSSSSTRDNMLGTVVLCFRNCTIGPWPRVGAMLSPPIFAR